MRQFILVFMFFVIWGCGQDTHTDQPTTNGLTHVQLALNWFPEAEHGGFYAALVHGYYREQGLAVEILGGGPDAPVIQRVATNTVAFGVTNADDVLYARAQKAPVVTLMAPYQINPRCIMVHEDSGIETIDDIKNITLAMSQRPAYSHYLRKKYSFEGVTIVPYPGNVSQFLLNRDFAQQGYIFSEPFTARAKGGDPKTLLVSDIGFNPYASVLIATQDQITAHPKVVRAMVQASVAGWQHYLRDGQETNEYINRLNPEMGLDILAYGISESLPLVLDPISTQHGLGYMSTERWETLLNQMVEAELIAPGAIIPTAAFTMEFMP